MKLTIERAKDLAESYRWAANSTSDSNRKHEYNELAAYYQRILDGDAETIRCQEDSESEDK